MGKNGALGSGQVDSSSMAKTLQLFDPRQTDGGMDEQICRG